MDIKKWIALALVALIMAGGVFSLHFIRYRQRLGMPGVVLSPLVLKDEEGKPVGTNSVYIPEIVAGIKGTLLPITKEELDALPVDTMYGRRLFAWPDQFQVQANVVLSGRDRNSIHRAQICLTAQGWTIEDTQEISIPMTKPHAYHLPAMKMNVSRRVKKGDEYRTVRALFVCWFLTDREINADHTRRMNATMLHVLRTGEMPRWAYASFMCGLGSADEKPTLERLTKFITEIVPEFQTTTLPQ
jgi:hypothetical protein